MPARAWAKPRAWVGSACRHGAHSVVSGLCAPKRALAAASRALAALPARRARLPCATFRGPPPRTLSRYSIAFVGRRRGGGVCARPACARGAVGGVRIAGHGRPARSFPLAGAPPRARTSAPNAHTGGARSWRRGAAGACSEERVRGAWTEGEERVRGAWMEGEERGAWAGARGHAATRPHRSQPALCSRPRRGRGQARMASWGGVGGCRRKLQRLARRTRAGEWPGKSVAGQAAAGRRGRGRPGAARPKACPPHPRTTSGELHAVAPAAKA